MIYGLYQSAAGMQVNQYRQNVISNNLANVDTAAYKRDLASFRERLVEAKSTAGAPRNALLDEMTGGVWPAYTTTDWSAGSADVTGNPLDAMITGEGFFAVQTPSGVRYTRAGQFAVDSQNRLVTVGDGYAVLGDAGEEITVPEDAQTVRLASDGKLLINDQPTSQLKLVNFEDASKARKVGDNLVASDAEPRTVQATLRVGAVERSNVDPMSEMAAMIEANRAYQLNAQMVTMQDASLGRLVSEVAKPI